MPFLVAFLALALASLADSCYIWGTDSGVCSTETLDPLWRQEIMPYCAEFVVYPACLPTYQTLPPTREFPRGRWFNHTITEKDRWVAENCDGHIIERIGLETNKSLQRRGTNEFGDKGRIKKRMHKNMDCQNAFKSLFCWLNFPRCDPNRDLTYPTCRSACENYFKACNYARDLWRCGKSKYFNGYGPEAPMVDAMGNVTYMREYFPGQPFRKNKYTTGGSEIGHCTPAITGAAATTAPFSSLFVFSLLGVVATALYIQN